jgi:hypothetical protein
LASTWLLQVEADARPVSVNAHRRKRVAGVTSKRLARLREIDRILEITHPPMDDEAGDLELAGLAPQFVAFLDLAKILELANTNPLSG